MVTAKDKAAVGIVQQLLSQERLAAEDAKSYPSVVKLAKTKTWNDLILLTLTL